MLALALIYAAGAFLAPSLFYSLAGLELLIAAVILLTWCSFSPPKTDGLQLMGNLLLCAGTVYFLFAWLQCLLRTESAFSPDSFSYYLLSQSFSEQFGLVGTIRQYAVPSDYNMSFPYFYPFACFLLQKVTGLSMHAGAVANLVFAGLTVFVLMDISLHYCGRAWPGQTVAAFLLSCTEYQIEVNSARAIPLALLLSLLVWHAIANLFSDGNKKAALLAGVAAGALTVTRFDGLALLVFGGLMIVLCRKGRGRALLGYVAAAAVPMLPWAVYSMRHFGVLWATDNAGTAFRVETVIPTAVFLPGETVQTLFNAPGEWFEALWQKISRVVDGLLACSPSLTVLGAGACIGLAVVVFKRRRELTAVEKRMLWALGALVVFYGAKTGVYALVGYGDYRYHIETMCVVTVWTLIVLVAVGKPAERIIRRGAGCLALCAAALIAMETNARDVAFRVAFRGESRPLEQAWHTPQRIEGLKQELLKRQVDPAAGILMLTIGAADYEFGGCCPDWKVYVQPANPTWERLEYMLDEYVAAEAILLESGWAADEGIEAELDKRYPFQEFTVEEKEYVLYELG